MIKLLKKQAIIFTVAALILTGCSKNNETGTEVENDTNKDVSAVVESMEEEKTEETIVSEELPQETEVPEEELPEEEIFPFVNPLTGLGTEKDLTNVRPVAMMVNNIKQSLPQIGISGADVVYEILEEGGITRLLCVFNDYADIPEIGSIRSARDYYIDIADAHDAVFLHAGGSTYAYTALANRGTNHIDGLYMSSFYRSAERRKTMATEHTLMISGAGVNECIEKKGYRTTSENPSPLTFGKDYKTGEKTANNISIPFVLNAGGKAYITSCLDYGSTSGMYHKSHFGTEHIDGATGEQLTFKNVLTLSCPMNRIAGDKLGCIQVHFTGTGTGTYSVDGTTREIVWKKPSRSEPYTLYEADGETPLVIAPGKSYIAVVSSKSEITIE